MSPVHPAFENHREYVGTSHHGRSIGRAILQGMLALMVDAGIGWFVFQAWLIDASADVRTAHPTGLTSAFCLLGLVFFSVMERQMILQIFICGFIGFLVGWGLLPTTSMNPERHFQLIRSGGWNYFIPFGICCGTFVGTLVGQNLDAIRRLIATINAASPRIAQVSKP